MSHTRWFRRLLKLLPADFQADYALEMERTFRDQHREAARDPRAVARLWVETLADLLRTAPREHADQLAQDVRYACRAMARRPGFSTVAALVFAVGIAATAAVFSVVQATILQPIPFDDAERLVAVREQTPEESRPWELSYVSYLGLRRDATSFEQLAAYMRNGIRIGGPEPELTDAVLISANLFETLRVRPLVGRSFTDGEDAPRGAAVAIVSEALARRRFGTIERAVGSAITIDERRTTIVGVLPESFRFPDAEVHVWLPIGQLGAEPWMQSRAVHVALLVGRLRRGVSVEQARAEATAWMHAIQTREPSADPRHQILLRTLAQQVSADVRPAVTALACAVLLLLAVTCSSVALLLLTHAAGRRNELAIRLALGARRARIARQLVTEALCLAAIGSAAGLAAAPVLLAFLVRGLGDALPPLVTPALDPYAFAVALFTATGTAVACGLVPAAHALGPVRMGATRLQRSNRYIVGAQVAISCVLLILASLLGRSLDRLLRVDLGFNPERLLVMRVTAPLTGYQGPGQMTRFYRDLIAATQALPGVVAATATSRPPLQEGARGDLTVEGQPRQVAPSALFRRVLPGYFATLGIALVEGRDFTDRDDGTGEGVVIVSRALARRYWPAGQAVGHRIKVGPADREPWLRIVGVVGSVRNRGLDDDSDLAAYEPHTQRPWNGMILLTRTTGEPQLMVETVRRAIRQLDPQAISSDVSTMEQRIEETVASRRFHATVVGAFAVTTLVLVGLALYGVLAYSVASRTREIGIRSAMGATSADLTWETLVEGVRPAVAGLAVGLAGSAAAAWLIRGLLFQVRPGDLPTYLGVTTLLLIVSIIGTWQPARRAARVDPSTALRTE